MGKRKTDAEFRADVKTLVGDEYIVLEKYQGAQSKIKIKHQKCGFVFEMTPDSLLRGHGCPQCKKLKISQALRKTNDEFCLSVKKLVGNEYLILDNYKGSRNKIRFKHQKCGSVFKMTPNAFLNGERCPTCRNKIIAIKQAIPFLKIKERINKVAQNEYKILSQNYISTHKKAIFLHKKCSHMFKMTPQNFLKGERCPFCKLSKGEKAITNYLQVRKIMFKTQFKISDCKDKYPLPFDFAVFNDDHSLNCLIEYQGEQHFYNPFSYHHKQWFNKKSILDTQKHDAMKLQYCKDHGIKLIRINHPQTDSKSNSIEFIERLVNRTLNKELKVS